MGADEEFVQRILDRRPHPSGEGFVYKVRWRGKPSSEDSWLTLEDLANCHDLVRAYNTTVDPLVSAPSVLPLEPLPGEVLKPTPPDPKTTFRRHPNRQGVTAGDVEGQDIEPADAQPPLQAPILDALLEPAISEGTDTFTMKDVLQVRPKGAGHEVEMSWENTWVPLDLLSPAACDRVRAFALEHHPDVTIPLGAGSASGHNDVSKVLAVRTGPSGPEAHVAWEPAWWLYSNLPSKSKAEAKAVITSMLDKMHQHNSDSTHAVTTDDNTDLPASRIQACARGMLDRMMFRSAQGVTSGPVCLAPSTFNRRGDPRAVGQADAGYLAYLYYLSQDDERRAWTADDDLTAAERRRCRTLLKELGLPVV